MTSYRRDHTAGASWFFTVNLADRSQTLLTDHVAALRAAFRYTANRHPFQIDAIVILPEHLHAIFTLPAGDADYPLRWRLIKTAFSRTLPRFEPVGASRQRAAERGVWQRRYWEHRLRDEDDFARHVDYIHINPMKHGLVARVGDWPYSSFHAYVRRGALPADWAGDLADSGDWGERK